MLLEARLVPAFAQGRRGQWKGALGRSWAAGDVLFLDPGGGYSVLRCWKFGFTYVHFSAYVFYLMLSFQSTKYTAAKVLNFLSPLWWYIFKSTKICICIKEALVAPCNLIVGGKCSFFSWWRSIGFSMCLNLTRRGREETVKFLSTCSCHHSAFIQPKPP